MATGLKIPNALYSGANLFNRNTHMESTSVNTKEKYSLKELSIYFLKLGTIGFGGPPALVSYMYRDLVEKKKWISESDYKKGWH